MSRHLTAACIEAATAVGRQHQCVALHGFPVLQLHAQPAAGLRSGALSAVRPKDLTAFQQHNQAFHRHIVHTAGNVALLRTWSSLEFGTRLMMATEDLSTVTSSP